MKDLEYYKEHIDELLIKTSSIEEQETVIVIPRRGTIRLSTSDNTMLTKVRQILKIPGTDWRLVGVSHSANEPDPNIISEIAIETDKKLVSVRPMKRTRPSADKNTEELPDSEEDE